jgi:hypothetical protein
MSVKPLPRFLVKYNGYILPGYIQGETHDNEFQVTDYTAPYSDDPYSENMGESPKSLTIPMLVWGDDYNDCKTQIRKAATYLRSKRKGYAKLYLGNSDRYYQVIPVSIKYQKAAKDIQTLSTYEITFKTKPYSESDIIHYLRVYDGSNIYGERVADTDSATLIDAMPVTSEAYFEPMPPYSGGAYDPFPTRYLTAADINLTVNPTTTPRTLDNGGFSPCFVTTVWSDPTTSHNPVTVLAYTDTGEFCGYMSLTTQDYQSGYTNSMGTTTESASPFFIDGINKVAVDGFGTNIEGLMDTPDYRIYVGPGKTYFTVSGAYAIEFMWRDRWYI